MVTPPRGRGIKQFVGPTDRMMHHPNVYKKINDSKYYDPLLIVIENLL